MPSNGVIPWKLIFQTPLFRQLLEHFWRYFDWNCTRKLPAICGLQREDKGLMIADTQGILLYATIITSLLQRFCKVIHKIRFVVDPYNPCVANRIVNGKQQMACGRFEIQSCGTVSKSWMAWLAGKIKEMRDTCNDYFAMVIDFSITGCYK